MRTDGNPRLSRNRNPVMPGSWEPGRFHLTDALVLKVVLIAMGVMRGIDYLTPSVRGWTPVTESMVGAFPLQVWAAMVLIPTATLMIGLLGRIHIAVWLGHGLLAGVYAALVVSLGLVYIERPFFDGMRSVTVLFLPATLHAVITARTGWRPPRWDNGGDEDREVSTEDG